MKDGVQVLGGYAGYGATNPDARGFLTVFSGDLNPNPPTTTDNFVAGNLPGTPHQYNNYSDNSYHVVFVPSDVAPFTGEPLKPHLDGVTIRSGNAEGLGGGGIHIEGGAKPHIRDCSIIENRAVDQEGGGVYASANSQAILRKCTIRYNDAVNGGGVAASFTLGTTLVRCTLEKNSASGGGGGFYAQRCQDLKLINTHFRGNASGNQGGGAYLAATSGTSTPTEITNCKFTGNAAAEGGGLFAGNLNLRMQGCTFSTNSATSGGAYGQNNAGSPNPVVRNCIFWNDSATTAPEIWLQSGSIDVTWSDVQQASGTYTGLGNINSNPQFVDPDGADNVANNADDNWRLACGSPCINTGDPEAADAPPDGVPTDGQDANENSNTTEKTPELDLGARIFGPRIDMGTYERTAVYTSCPGDVNSDGAVNVLDLLAVIGNWGACAAPCPYDLTPEPCGDGTVNVPDLLFVIAHWGGCLSGGGQAPQTVEDCYDDCMGEMQTEQGFYDCFDACIEALCQQALLPECAPES